MNCLLQFLWTYDDNDGHIFFKVVKISLKGLRDKHKAIVAAVTPPKIIFETIKMSVGLFLISHPDADWKI